MSTLGTVVAAASVIFGGAFWSTLKVNFEPAFARRFLLPMFLVATLNCVVLARFFGWWTVLVYLVLMFAGSIAEFCVCSDYDDSVSSKTKARIIADALNTAWKKKLSDLVRGIPSSRTQ